MDKPPFQHFHRFPILIKKYSLETNSIIIVFTFMIIPSFGTTINTFTLLFIIFLIGDHWMTDVYPLLSF
ncbi:hypothetical protein B4V02_19700 [Paenibacillus kribbensis]|uniref:Uncharacterized protein n=1 Tax=Paenibacillus kribbensis TaxID=172713 RepID=A0A222WQE6_9BACL|nr:hypothetical protein B4V02_19700 [Paenibacillus kribbensis]